MKCCGARLLSFLAVCLVIALSALCAEQSTPAKAREPKVDATEKEPARTVSLAQKLSRRVTVSTDGDVLRDFIRRLSDETDINVVLDDRLFDTRPEPRLREIRLKNVPLRAALKVVLRTVGLDYKAYEHFIFISTPARLRHDPLENLETRFYELKGSTGDSLPKVVLMNPAATGQGNFGSITQLTRPANPALVGEAAPSGRTR